MSAVQFLMGTVDEDGLVVVIADMGEATQVAPPFDTAGLPVAEQIERIVSAVRYAVTAAYASVDPDKEA